MRNDMPPDQLDQALD